MFIRYDFPDGSLEQQAGEHGALFLRTPRAWLSFFPTRQTRYEGWYLGDEQPLPHTFFKIIESIRYPTAPITGTTITHQWSRWEHADGFELTFLPGPDESLHPGCSSLSVLTNRAAPLSILLDIRGIYQQPDFGRSYEFQTVGNHLEITYTDPQLGQSLYVVIRGASLASQPENPWEEVAYPRDSQRHSGPDHLYTYRLNLTPSNRLDWGVGWSRETARVACNAAALNLVAPLPNQPAVQPTALAMTLVEQSLEHLHTHLGYYAGLPWFHQVWSRDELITALGLSPKEQRRIIEHYLTFTLDNGELPTYLGSGTSCADGLGWLALLVREYGLDQFDEPAREQLRTFFSTAYHQLRSHRFTPSNLVWSGHNATWMDTIGRAGFRLEIQTMAALVLELLRDVVPAQHDHYEADRQELLATIRHQFYHENYLIDGVAEDGSLDARKRPNVFLAYLLQPDLLASAQWESCFDLILAALSTTWGGLTSLDTADPLFVAESTGQDNCSYHQGDSWFFVNNLAALALFRCNVGKYGQQIAALAGASTQEILWQHFLGCPGEIAAAATGQSWGCGIQGFSGGTYLALMRALTL